MVSPVVIGQAGKCGITKALSVLISLWSHTLLLLKYQCAHIDEVLRVISASPVSKMLVFGILIKFCQWLNEMVKWSWVLTRTVRNDGEGLRWGSRWTWILLMKLLLTTVCFRQFMWPACRVHFLIMAWGGIDDLVGLLWFSRSMMLSSVPFLRIGGVSDPQIKTRLPLSWTFLWLFGNSSGLETPFNLTKPLCHP